MDKKDTIKIEGFELELQTLPSVAKHFASYDTKKLGKGSPIEPLIELSRQYLELLLKIRVKQLKIK